jgi:hypothetical protein
MNPRLLAALLVASAVWITSANSNAANACDGPELCCGPIDVENPTTRTTVSVGVAIQGVHNLDEKAGGWDVDYYLYEKWPASRGFTPQTEIVNETAREDSPRFELVELKNGFCQRSRRLHSTLRVEYDLRRFPFDQQKLLLVLSDAEYDAGRLVYSEQPTVADIDEHVRSQVSAWNVHSAVGYGRDTRRFTGEEGSPPYDYATFSVPVERRVAFHLTKFFLPLFIIVIVSFAVFWIEPDDLNTQVSIGVTCLLAAIAFQFAESNRLPEVAYLTLADRIYVACYLAIALTIVGSIYAHSLVRKNKHRMAVSIVRRFRLLFPAALLVAVGVSIALSFRT